jgi:hypothetical protein
VSQTCYSVTQFGSQKGSQKGSHLSRLIPRLGDAKWIVIRGQLRGHNDTPFEWPTPGRTLDCPVDGRPQGVFGGFSYSISVISFFNIVPLIMEFTSEDSSCQSVLTSWLPGQSIQMVYKTCSKLQRLTGQVGFGGSSKVSLKPTIPFYALKIVACRANLIF